MTAIATGFKNVIQIDKNTYEHQQAIKVSVSYTVYSIPQFYEQDRKLAS